MAYPYLMSDSTEPTATTAAAAVTNKVAYLGPPGSFTYQAARGYFKVPTATTTTTPAQSEVQLAAQASIEDVFQAVEDGTATYGVVPFENSSAGTVNQTLDRFVRSTSGGGGDDKPRSGIVADATSANPHHRKGVWVRDQYFLPIVQCLLVQRSPPLSGETSPLVGGSDGDINGGDETTTTTTPSAGLGNIRTVYSHPMGLLQCDRWLKTHLPHVERVTVTSTSRAAELAAQDPHAAAIGSAACVEFYNVRVARNGIEDCGGNTTRFFVIHRKPGLSTTAPGRSYLYFTVDHRRPGALSEALAVFGQFELNLSKIDTRPSQLLPWHFYFFAECTGHHQDEVVQNAMRQLELVATDVVVLGSYPDPLGETA
ncbi:prephenate dehydratase [Tieghemiomyces parasiticus]|uniref:prephenate dehydratase n=1 Tax=Tieghemiomyces parasiticus TaxID=78921 RepID=A0A9W8AE93_9FUNG|nr:prephenate dehydratase [Tieghemiomyces parasiticus]